MATCQAFVLWQSGKWPQCFGSFLGHVAVEICLGQLQPINLVAQNDGIFDCWVFELRKQIPFKVTIQQSQNAFNVLIQHLSLYILSRGSLVLSATLKKRSSCTQHSGNQLPYSTCLLTHCGGVTLYSVTDLGHL